MASRRAPGLTQPAPPHLWQPPQVRPCLLGKGREGAAAHALAATCWTSVIYAWAQKTRISEGLPLHHYSHMQQAAHAGWTSGRGARSPSRFCLYVAIQIIFTTSLRRSFLMTASNGVSAAATFPSHGATGARKL